MNAYLPRELSVEIERALSHMPVVVLTGLRQTGKSTILTEDRRFSGRDYVTLDDLDTLEALRSNPGDFLEGREAVTIDEAQRIPELFVMVKTLVDRQRAHARFLLSGSANPALLREVTESLAGRAIYYELSPMTRREIRRETGAKPFLAKFWEHTVPPASRRIAPLSDLEVERGGLPPVALSLTADAGLWFKGYEQTYLERDLREVARVDNMMGFRRLLRLAAHRTAQILNVSDLARDAELPVKTAYRYLGWMETSFVIRRVHPYRRGGATRLTKSPKLFFADSGLANYLAGGMARARGILAGPMYETYVAQNLLGGMESHMPGSTLFYWRVHGAHEVDFVIEGADGATMAIEVKSGARWTSKDLAGLKAFLEATPDCKAALLAYNGERALKLGDRLWAIPIALLLS